MDFEAFEELYQQGDELFTEEDAYVFDGLEGDYDDDEAYVPDGLAQKPIMKHLANNDYTLNSPLIADNVDGFKSMLLYGSCLSIFMRYGWKEISEEFLKLGVARDSLSGSSTFHKWFVKIEHSIEDNDRFMELIRETDRDAEQTHPILKAYLKGWANVSVSHRHRSTMRGPTRDYGSKFLLFHLITLALNCTTEDEASNINKLLGSESIHNKKTGFFFTKQHQKLGTIVIGGGFMWCKNGNQLLDRNMVLMTKDTLGGRFQTLLHSEFKIRPKYPGRHYEEIHALFQSGDALLLEGGSVGYNGIKLLEPLALGEIHKRASYMRNRVPKFTHFEEHLSQEVLKTLGKCPSLIGFTNVITTATSIESLVTMYGSFRLWGHPFIDYFEGLKAMHHNTTLVTEIEEIYAQQIASDFVKTVLRKKMLEEKRWMVEKSLVPDDHPLSQFIQSETWPSADTIARIGDVWHELPLKKCFDLPDVIDPSTIYSDKSHSMNLNEVIEHVAKTQGTRPIPTLSVLESQMSKPATDVKKFLQKINDEGLERDHLIIGLRAKERELKIAGRFFSLMSWELREYFVITEYLIKTHFVPLCKGLTMADDFNTVTSKMQNASKGQNTTNYNNITIANHVDYTKWNNYQRGKANNPIFKAMGQFLGLPNLFTRTHEFFEQSLFYYKDRPDLMSIDGDELVNKPGEFVCWRGQLGGCEGLRQKGWSVVNYFSLLRQSQVRNTEMKYLMQGDNQVICCYFRTRASRYGRELDTYLREIYNNNQAIMESIREGTNKLGLFFNHDETLQSAQVMVYGKVILINGSIIGLPEKRMSRCLCTTNDQVPSLGTVSGTVVTNLLTVCHYANDVVNSMFQYNWVGNFARILLERHNPAIRGPLPELSKDNKKVKFDLRYKIRYLYLDPSLGGVGGVSLTRFLIRQFPDQVTEALSFWKVVYNYSASEDIKIIASEAGNPRLMAYTSDHFGKLLESPTGLNIHKGFSIATLLKRKIKSALLSGQIQIRNEIIEIALNSSREKDTALILFLETIKPLFPRFLSEFYNSTFAGLVNGFINMFENSRTIRSTLKNSLGEDLDQKMIASEYASIYQLAYKSRSGARHSMWPCSSTKADSLRELSWGCPVLGATIPHPLELLRDVKDGSPWCPYCDNVAPFSDYIAVRVGGPFPEPLNGRGPYDPYLGSKTSETTSIIQPWERETNIPIVKRAYALRKSLSWFIDTDSNLAQSIHNNIKALTGDESRKLTAGFKRSGSSIHRFACSRQSTGGFSGIAPNLASHMIMTSDTLLSLGEDNYDCMFQSMLIYAQVSTVARHFESDTDMTYHFHIGCEGCVRPIEEPTLECPIPFEFPDLSSLLDKFKPDDVSWYRETKSIELVAGDWGAVNNEEKSIQVGTILGYYFTDRSATSPDQISDLFPIVIKRRLSPVSFVRGIVYGVSRAAAMGLLKRPTVLRGRSHQEALYGAVHDDLTKLCQNPAFLNLCSGSYMAQLTVTRPHRVPASYPISTDELGSVIAGHLRHVFQTLYPNAIEAHLRSPLWIFSEFLEVSVAGSYILSTQCLRVLLTTNLTRDDRNLLRAIGDQEICLRSKEADEELITSLRTKNKVYICPEEVRHACKSIIPPHQLGLTSEFEPFLESYKTKVDSIQLELTSLKSSSFPPLPRPADLRNPLISGLRIPQLATGSFLKISGLLKHFNISYTDFICGGDGSGGLTASLARHNLNSRYVFNSLFEGENVHTRGVTPAPPSVLSHMSSQVADRCVNLTRCWEEPTDLRREETWKNFIHYIHSKHLYVDLLLLDMQVLETDQLQIIEDQMIDHMHRVIRMLGTAIVKTYLIHLIRSEGAFINKLSKFFRTISLAQLDIAGSNTGEIYIVAQDLLPESSADGGVFWDTTQSWFLDRYCYRSHRREFLRALEVFRSDLKAGIPSVYFPDHRDELIDILAILGIDPTQRNIILLNNYPHIQLKTTEGMLCLLCSITENVIPTRKISVRYPIVPSDMRLLKLISFQVGFFFWLAVRSKNLWLYERLVSALQNPISFYYYIVYLEEAEQHLVWSYRPFTSKNKTLRLDSMHGFISRVIRLFSTIDSTTQLGIDFQLLRSIIEMDKNSRSSFELVRRSGTLEWLGDLALSTREEVNSFPNYSEE